MLTIMYDTVREPSLERKEGPGIIDMAENRETPAPTIATLEGSFTRPTEALSNKCVSADDERGKAEGFVFSKNNEIVSKALTKPSKTPRRSRRTKQHSSLAGLFSAKNAPKTLTRKHSNASSEATAGSTNHIAIHSHQNGQTSRASPSAGETSPLTLVKVDTCNGSVDSDLSSEEYIEGIEITISEFTNEKSKKNTMIENDSSRPDVYEGSSKNKKWEKVAEKISTSNTNSIFSKESSKSQLTTHSASDVDGLEEQPSTRNLVILSTTDNEQYVEEVKDVIDTVQDVGVDISDYLGTEPLGGTAVLDADAVVPAVEVDISGYLGTEPLGGTTVLDAGAGSDYPDETAKNTSSKKAKSIFTKKDALFGKSQDGPTVRERKTTGEHTHENVFKMRALTRSLVKAKSLFATKNTKDCCTEKKKSKLALDIANKDVVSFGVVPLAGEEKIHATQSTQKEEHEMTAGDVPRAHASKRKVVIISTINVDERMKEITSLDVSETEKSVDEHVGLDVSEPGNNIVGKDNSRENTDKKKKKNKIGVSAAARSFFLKRVAISQRAKETKQDVCNETPIGSKEVEQRFEQNVGPLLPNDIDQEAQLEMKETSCKQIVQQEFSEQITEAPTTSSGFKDTNNEMKKEQNLDLTEPTHLSRASSSLSKTEGTGVTDIDTSSLSKATIEELKEASLKNEGSSVNLPVTIVSACIRDEGFLEGNDSCSTTSQAAPTYLNAGDEQSINKRTKSFTEKFEEKVSKVSLSRTSESNASSLIKDDIDKPQDEERDEGDNLQAQRESGPARDDSSSSLMNTPDNTAEMLENVIMPCPDESPLDTCTVGDDSSPDSPAIEADGFSKRASSFSGTKEENSANAIEGQNLSSQSEDPIGILAE